MDHLSNLKFISLQIEIQKIKKLHEWLVQSEPIHQFTFPEPTKSIYLHVAHLTETALDILNVYLVYPLENSMSSFSSYIHLSCDGQEVG